MEHILFEHVSGYELFEMKSFEGLAPATYMDYLSLTQVVNHVSSLPLPEASDVLAHIHDESGVPEQLKNFLEMNNVSVLHADKSLRESLAKIGIAHKESRSIMRGIKQNIHKILKTALNKQLVLSTSHMLSREAIRYDMEREDNIAIAVGYECEQLENEIEVLTRRMEGMVDMVIPQFKKLIGKDEYNSRLAAVLDGTSWESTGKSGDTLVGTLVADVLGDLSPADTESLRGLNRAIAHKKSLLGELTGYLEEKMRGLAPNLRHILGDRLATKMIHKAGGLTNLSLLPASTLQLLGAEKSLFRSLKMRTNTPKYGLLYELEYLKENKGRMCRFIAAKSSLAARIDSFSKDRTDAYGRELRKLIDKKMSACKKGVTVETTHDLLARVQESITRMSNVGAEKVSSGSRDEIEMKDTKKTVDKKGSAKDDGRDFSSKGARLEDKKGSEDSGKPEAGSAGPRSTKKKGLYDLTEAAKGRMVSSSRPIKKDKNNDNERRK